MNWSRGTKLATAGAAVVGGYYLLRNVLNEETKFPEREDIEEESITSDDENRLGIRVKKTLSFLKLNFRLHSQLILAFDDKIAF